MTTEKRTKRMAEFAKQGPTRQERREKRRQINKDARRGFYKPYLEDRPPWEGEE